MPDRRSRLLAFCSCAMLRKKAPMRGTLVMGGAIANSLLVKTRRKLNAILSMPISRVKQSHHNREKRELC